MILKNTLNSDQNVIINLGDPVDPQDAVNFRTLQRAIEGMAPKGEVRAATTTNISLSGLSVVDSVVLLDGDRVLVKDQANLWENGLYIARPGAWERDPRANTWEEVQNAYVSNVFEGAANALTAWVALGGNTGTIGVSVLTFELYARNNLPADVARKRETDFGDGVATVFTFVHNLGRPKPCFRVWDNSTGYAVEPDVRDVDLNTIEAVYSIPPGVNEFHISVTG